MKHLFVITVVVSALGFATEAISAGSDGRFVIRGAGLLNCSNFVEEKEKQSNAYFMIAGWIDGYITGVNRYKTLTYDITSYESTELLARLIDNHCSSNPDDRLYTVMNSIVSRIDEHRIEDATVPVIVEVGDQSTRIYPSTLLRIQNQLTEAGYYSGPIHGRYDSAVIEAMKSHQASIGFQSTGFPDQASVWFLLENSGSQ